MKRRAQRLAANGEDVRFAIISDGERDCSLSDLRDTDGQSLALLPFLALLLIAAAVSFWYLVLPAAFAITDALFLSRSP